MKIAHSITINVFSKPEDDDEQIRTGLIALIPFNLEETKLEVSSQKATGFNERRIVIHSITLVNQQHTTKWIEWFLSKLTREQKQTIFEQIDSRIDDKCKLYIRIHKTTWAQEQDILLTDSGECYHITIAVAVYPKNKQNAVKIAMTLLKDEKNI